MHRCCLKLTNRPFIDVLLKLFNKSFDTRTSKKFIKIPQVKTHASFYTYIPGSNRSANSNLFFHLYSAIPFFPLIRVRGRSINWSTNCTSGPEQIYLGEKSRLEKKKTQKE